ncbi:MAG: bifunctional fucokinase/L-fucose-1-P-guanylyltransferase [Lachnospiraceae bacterium]|nr:bifunctional fucokinase/L-fucose-1-P-guanylyltransferase [Lachnospiraceae bacterium]
MNKTYTNNQLQHLFLQQSCVDAWEEYLRQIKNSRAILWDYVILTASNEEQAAIYRSEIEYRLGQKKLPSRTTWLVLPDPEGKRVGSGGATLNVLREIAQREQKAEENFFTNLRILVIHSGGDSKRIPQYSTCGKLFSPVPRVLPDGRASTLFDEFMITTSMIPGRMQEGMLVMSGDVLLLFNALQMDTQFNGAAAISIKEDVNTGKNHGVFLGDSRDNVQKFLHKQSVDTLDKLGAVNRQQQVDLDTGAILMDTKMLASLYSLISTDNHIDEEKFNRFVNEKARISFYGDFLYPLATDSTLADYEKEAPEGELCQELLDCRKQIWQVLKDYQLKLIRLSPAEFIHFGTTRELRRLVTETVEDYTFLGWSRVVFSNAGEEGSGQLVGRSVPSSKREEQKKPPYALHNTFVEDGVTIGKGAYVENSLLAKGVTVGDGAIVSGLSVPTGYSLKEDTVYHGLKLQRGSFVVRVYGVEDNPKGSLEGKESFLGTTLEGLMRMHGLTTQDLWDGEEHSLWKAKLYPAVSSIEQGMKFADTLLKMTAMSEEVMPKELDAWKKAERVSLYSSFNEADGSAIIPWRENLEDEIRVATFVQRMLEKKPVKEALKIFGGNMRRSEQKLLLSRIPTAGFSEKIRIYYGMAQAARLGAGEFGENDEENYMQLCFNQIQEEIREDVEKRILGEAGIEQQEDANYSRHIVKEEVNVALPVRVNWGGGWTDTPPHCQEQGGVVLNAAILLDGNLPIRVSLRRLKEPVLELESQDIGAHGIFTRMEEVNDCGNPFDRFALHKAALIACGIIRNGDTRELSKVLETLGGGIYLSTQVINVPKGSGLGTSSILAGACAKGLFEFLGEKVEEALLYDVVLCMEQLMSTGGGWQDQVGGLTPGIKMITTRPGIRQKIQVSPVRMDSQALKELQERFALIYTGQRRLARNLLREVVGGYIGNRTQSLEALEEMKRIAVLMQFELEQGNIDAFARLLNRHWELSIQLDGGSTNTCIQQIFLSCEDMIDGKFIAGAGGGGFLQVILKKGVTREQLRERLYAIFQDSGVDVWDCSFV